MIFNEVIEGQELKPIAKDTIIRKGMAIRGIRGHNNTGIVLDDELLSKHILTLGSIGSGKSNLMFHIVKAIINSLSPDDMIIFFDAKGDYIDEFYRNNYYVIGNPKKIGENCNVVYWNLFNEILHSPDDEQTEVIREIASSLFKKTIDSSNNPAFPMGARDIFCALVIACLREAQMSNFKWNNKKFKEFLDKASIVDIRESIMKFDDLRWATTYIMGDKNVTTQGYLSELNLIVQDIFTGAFGAEGDFSIINAIQNKGGKSIFLEYDISKGNILEAVYTVLIDLAMKESLGRSKPKGNVFFILDEFPLIPKLNYIDNALNFGRSLGVKVIGGIQNVAQMEYRYGSALTNSLLSGFGTFFIFKLFDEKSRQIVSERHGKNRRKVGVMSSNSYKGVDDSIMITNVIEDWDIVKLNVGQCIVSLLNEEPFFFWPHQYIKEGASKGK
jgi:type IV secretory pathway TraG/TraD family ATPase VirD4